MKVVFDLGNVVLDWNTDAILDSLDQSRMKKDQLRRQLFEHSDWLDMDRGLRSESAVAARVVERSDLQHHDVAEAFLAAKSSLVPIPDSVRLIEDIHDAGIELYCLSNMSLETFEFIERLEFFDRFEGIVISGKERCIKPDTRIYRLLIDRYRLRPRETLFVDDSIDNVRAAENIGIKGIHFKRSKNCYSKIRQLLL